MGAKVTQLPGGEIIPALDKGVIDAFEFNNPTSDMRFGAQDVIKNYMMGSYHQAMEFFEIAFNKKKWDSLPKDLQAILRYSTEAVHRLELVDGDGQLLARPAGADRQAQGQRGAHAEVGDGRAAEGLGRADQEAVRRGPVLRQGGRVAARLGQARRRTTCSSTRPTTPPATSTCSRPSCRPEPRAAFGSGAAPVPPPLFLRGERAWCMA